MSSRTLKAILLLAVTRIGKNVKVNVKYGTVIVTILDNRTINLKTKKGDRHQGFYYTVNKS